MLLAKWNDRENQIALVYIYEKNNPGNWPCEFQVAFSQSSEHQEMMGFCFKVSGFSKGSLKGDNTIKANTFAWHNFSRRSFTANKGSLCLAYAKRLRFSEMNYKLNLKSHQLKSTNRLSTSPTLSLFLSSPFFNQVHFTLLQQISHRENVCYCIQNHPMKPAICFFVFF